jgi:hypothetical protein
MFVEMNQSFNGAFLSETGVRIDHFIELALVLKAGVTNGTDPIVHRSFFRPIEPNYPGQTIELFLKSLSLDMDEARQSLCNREKEIPPSRFYEHYEETPLRRFPLLKHGDKFVPYSSRLLDYALETFVHDVLKESSPEAFVPKFGRLLFQPYIEKALKYAKWPFMNEDELRKAFRVSEKVVDFLIQHENINVFVEAKGVELAELGKVSHMPVVVRGKIKDSLLRAVEQGYSTAAQMQKLKLEQGQLINPDDNFLLVITFKDFYVGNGRDLYDFLAKDEIDDIVKRYGKEWIPIDHVYFLVIDDLDVIAEAFRGHPDKLINCLKRAALDDKDPSTKKFVFQQHLEVQFKELGKKLEFPDYIDKAHKTVVNSYQWNKTKAPVL